MTLQSRCQSGAQLHKLSENALENQAEYAVKSHVDKARSGRVREQHSDGEEVSHDVKQTLSWRTQSRNNSGRATSCSTTTTSTLITSTFFEVMTATRTRTLMNDVSAARGAESVKTTPTQRRQGLATREDECPNHAQAEKQRISY